MMEKYFAFKYYEEVAGYIIMAVLIVGAIALPFILTAFDAVRRWWKGEK